MAMLTSSPPRESPTAPITSARRAMPRRAAHSSGPSSGCCFPVDKARPTPASTANSAAARPENASPIQVGVSCGSDSKVASTCVAIMASKARPRAASMPASRAPEEVPLTVREAVVIPRAVII